MYPEDKIYKKCYFLFKQRIFLTSFKKSKCLIIKNTIFFIYTLLVKRAKINSFSTSSFEIFKYKYTLQKITQFNKKLKDKNNQFYLWYFYKYNYNLKNILMRQNFVENLELKLENVILYVIYVIIQWTYTVDYDLKISKMKY